MSNKALHSDALNRARERNRYVLQELLYSTDSVEKLDKLNGEFPR